MNRLLIVAAILLFSVKVMAQGFPNTDSLRTYNIKYITNNPATAFTNLRLHTLLRGIIDHIDTARSGGGSAIGVDTLWALNDSTIRYRKNGVFRNVVLKGVYDTRRKVDTMYKVNDTTIGFTINGVAKTIILSGRHDIDSIYRKSGQDSIFYRKDNVEYALKDSTGGPSQNLSNTSLTANGDYFHDWSNYLLDIENISSLALIGTNFDIESSGLNGSYNRQQKTTLSGSGTNGSFPLTISHVMRNAANGADSISNVITATGSVALNMYSQNAGTGRKAEVVLNQGGSGSSFVQIKGDSVNVQGIPRTTADSVWGVGPYVAATKTNSLIKVPFSSGASGPAGGDLTGTYPNPTIADDAITATKFRQSAGLSVIGNFSNTTDYPVDIVAANDGNVLRRFGTSLGFGAINLASTNAVTGNLPVTHLNSGTGASGSTFWRGDGTWATPAGITSLAAIGSSPNANGASISGATLTLQPANGSFGGIITTTPQSFSGNKFYNDSIGIGTTSPLSALHISKASDGTTGNGTFARITDSRTTGNYRIAGTILETNTNTTQLLSTTGDGLSFEPYNNLRGTYLRNITNNGGVYITTNKAGAERKSLSIIGDSVGIGYNHQFTGAAYGGGGGFGGYPTLIGGQTYGNGTAIGWSAQATNVEAVAVGPQTVANALATIAIGDGTRAMADSSYGNEIVIGDAAWAKGNINLFLGSGAGLHHDYTACLSCWGSSTNYDIDASTAGHQGFLGWYQHNSSYFSDGRGLHNDWWLGGPVRASAPHDITLNMTSLIGGDKDGINFSIIGSRPTGAGVGGDIIFKTGDQGATDTVLRNASSKFTIKGSGNLIAKSLITTGTAPTTSGATKMLISDENGLMSFTDIPSGSSGGITTLNSLTSSSQGFSTGSSGTDFNISSSSSTHTFNIPSASASNRGLVTTGTQEFAGDKQYDDNIGIGTANTGTNSILIQRNNNDGGATDQPFIRIRNSYSSNPSGSGYNIAGITMGAGNDAILGQFGMSYGTGATAPWNQQAFIVATRTDDPIIFATGSSTGNRLIINNNGVIGVPNLAGSGVRLVTADASGQLGVTSTPSVTDDAYDATTWNGSAQVPTKNAVRDKIESLNSITSINSQTGSSQTISAGPGLAVSSSSDVHTISFNNTLDYQVSDANNTGTSATDLYSKTIAANQFTLNGQSIHFEAAGVNNDATATVNLEALFAGNGIAGTGAVTISATGAWTITGTIIRATSTTARVYTTVTIDQCTQKVFLTTANLTGLDWTATNVLKIRATAGGAGGGSNDITAQMWKVVYQP